ncbi:MAG: Ycf66 family protein [Synechococcaceae cyanobacterium]|nr:Ycf66 family protein [Synechococcaceae cyanobacterium]
MLATLGGALALVVGVAVLLLPVLVSELSRPRDAAWGAVVLLLGLVLVTSAERLTGSPMLAVLCGGLLIGRLGSEVGLARWRQLTPEERQRLGSSERWRSGLGQLGASLAGLLGVAGGALGGLGGTLRGLGAGLGTGVGSGGRPRRGGKRWVRPEPPAAEPAEAAEPGDSAEATAVRVVDGFAAIDAHLAATEAPPEPPTPDEAG